MTTRIGERPVGRAHPVFIVAEMSGNHGGSLDRALQIVDAVADAGADAIKLQTFTADTMTLDVDRPGFTVEEPESLWYGRQLYELYDEAHTPWEWHEAIFERARRQGLEFFSSPFDATAVAFLDKIGVPCFKIASIEIVDLPLIRAAAATGKPLIISTGVASLEEVAEAVTAARDAGCRDIILLKCTTSYPARPEDSHLATIADLRQRFDCHVGVSDHTLGIGAAIAGATLGACVIEKHVTLDRDEGTVDAAFSLEPSELALLVREVNAARRALGEIRYGPTDSEAGAAKRRRSLYIAQDLRAGDELTTENLRSIRPGGGLPPKHLDDLLGRRVRTAVTKGTPANWSLIDP